MKTILYILTFISLVSCCRTRDSTVPVGFPFNGHTQEIKFFEYNNPVLFSQNIWMLEDSIKLQGVLIRNASDCEAYFRIAEPSYVSDIDFNKFDLSFLNASLGYSSDEYFQERLIIDHKHKTCTAEVRAHSYVCWGWGLEASTKRQRKYILIPKLPANYKFSFKTFFPAYN